MKRKIFTIITLSTLSIGYTLAQRVDSRETLTAGIKAGMNISNVWDSKGDKFNADPKAGFAGGVFFSIPMGELTGIQPEILLSQKGFQGSGTIGGLPYSTRRTTTYLDIPLQLQYKPTPILTILAGPQYSYLLHQKDVFTFYDNTSILEKEFENDNIRKNILGFVTGIDINIDNVIFSSRIGWDLQTNNGDGTSQTPRYKNRWIQFTIGFRT